MDPKRDKELLEFNWLNEGPSSVHNAALCGERHADVFKTESSIPRGLSERPAEGIGTRTTSPRGFRTNSARTTPCRPVTATTLPSSWPSLSYAFLPRTSLVRNRLNSTTKTVTRPSSTNPQQSKSEASPISKSRG
jgi:hypothetical protein